MIARTIETPDEMTIAKTIKFAILNHFPGNTRSWTESIRLARREWDFRSYIEEQDGHLNHCYNTNVYYLTNIKNLLHFVRERSYLHGKLGRWPAASKSWTTDESLPIYYWVKDPEVGRTFDKPLKRIGGNITNFFSWKRCKSDVPSILRERDVDRCPRYADQTRFSEHLHCISHERLSFRVSHILIISRATRATNNAAAARTIQSSALSLRAIE